MNFSDRQGLTEECPLTKDKNSRCTLCYCCQGGFKLIVCCFIILSFGITLTLILQLLYTNNGLQNKTVTHGAVATDYTNCSQIGTKILRKGGNAIDAAIAATVCMTVVAPYRTSIGGGGYIMIYDHKDRLEPMVIDFASNTIQGAFGTVGIRIPAVLGGLEFAHALYGILSWHDVIKPSANLARTGFIVSKEFVYEMSNNSNYGMLYNHINAGDTLPLNDLADTLDIIAEYGSIALYNGTLSQKILNDQLKKEELQEQLANYKPEIGIAKKSIFYKHVVYYPFHAVPFQSLINALQKLQIPSENVSTIESQLLVAKTLLQFNPIPPKLIRNVEQERYTGVMVMDWQDIYVSVVTGLSAPLSSSHMTSAGFTLDKIVNDNDLSTFIPIIFHDEKAICRLRGVLGTDDAILSSQILYNLIVRNLNISTAIEYPRYYYLSDDIIIENDQGNPLETVFYDQLNSLKPILHVDANMISKSVNSIIKRKDSMMSHSDSRGGGLASRF